MLGARADIGGKTALYQVSQSDSVMNDMPSLEILVDRARIAFSGKPGFAGCDIYTNTPPVLEFRFLTPTDAVRFQIQRSLVGSTSEFKIDPKRLDVVLETISMQEEKS